MPEFDLRPFDRRLVIPGSKPMATLRRNGTLSLNPAAVQALGNPAAVELLYDPAARAVGFRPIDPEEPTAVRVHIQRGSHWLWMGRLCSYYRIDNDRALRYEAVFDEGLLVIELDKPVAEVVRRNKN